MKPPFRRLLQLLLLTILIAACTPSGTGRGFAYIWYVATTGADTNICDEPTAPCLTVAGALEKARATEARVGRDYPGETVSFVHTINVADGVYMVAASHEGYPFVRADINVTINGAGRTTTIFDAANTYGGIFIHGDVRVTLRNFTVRNVVGSAPDSCINIREAATVTIENVVVRSCKRNGIDHTSSGPLTLINVVAVLTVLEDSGDFGHGVMSHGEVSIVGGRFFRNEGAGVSILSGNLTMNRAVVEFNERDGIHIVSSNATLNGVNVHDNGQDLGYRFGLFLGTGASVTATDTTISANPYGVLIYGEGSRLELIDSVVRNNPGTGIVVSNGELSLLGTTVEGNGAANVGTSLVGGIHTDAGTQTTIRNSQISANLNGGISNFGELTLTETVMSGNDGGLPVLLNNSGASAVVERSLLANNIRTGRRVVGDGAIENRGTMDIVNSTITANAGDGLGTVGPLQLSFSTIAFNLGTGFATSESASASPRLIGNLIVGNGVDCYVPRSPGGAIPVVDGPSFDSDGTCDFPTTVPLITLRLDALADNGGPTQTHALLSGSPAIDAYTFACTTEDQRLYTRPFGLGCDLGAYEASGSALSLEATLGSDTPTPGTLIAIPEVNYNCRYGNSSLFDIADTLKAGQEYTPLAKGVDLLWVQFAGPSFGTLCWASVEGLTFYLNGNEITVAEIPENVLGFAVYPAEPTATTDPDESLDATETPTATPKPKPSPTSTCYYDKNQNYICP